MATRIDWRLTGLNSLAYMGADPLATPYLLTNNRAPTVNDRKNFQIGDLWIDRTTLFIWILVNLDAGVATWIRFGTGAEIAAQFTADVGVALPAGGEVNVFGLTVLETAGATNNLSIDFINGLDGQIIIGATGTDPAWANITSTGATVTITNGANSINLEAVGVASLDQLTADAGVAIPVAGVVYIEGGTNIETGAAGDALVIRLSDNVTLAGTLTLSYLGAGVLQTDATGLVFSDNGTNGQVLIGGGTEANWANITSALGTITITNGVNSINLEAVGGGPAGPDSSFLAVIDVVANVSLIGTATFYLGENLLTMTEIFDRNNDFDVGGGVNKAVFVAPVTGKYHLTFTCNWNGTGTSPSLTFWTNIAVNNYYFYRTIITATDSTTIAVNGEATDTEVVLDLTVGDIVGFNVYKSFPTIDIIQSDIATLRTWVSGNYIEA